MTTQPASSLDDILGFGDDIGSNRTTGHGRDGKLPLTEDMLLNEPSGNLFGLTLNVAMG